YSFGGLRPGRTYEVSEAGMFGEAARTTPAPEVVTMRSGEDYVATENQRDALVSGGESADEVIVEPTMSIGNRAGSIRGQKWVDLNGDGERLSVNLVRQSNGLFQDEFGGSEKWFRGADGGWYFIEPDGTLTEWDETPGELSGEVVAELGSTMYEQPGRLLEAPREPAENGWEIELLNSDGHVIETATTQDRDLDGDGRIDPATERGVYSFTGVPPGDYTIREVGKSGWTRSAPADGGTHSVSIGVERLKAAELGLHRDSGTFYRDAFDGSEKWLRGEGDEWYYMTSDGTLTRWDAEPGRLGGDVVASLDSSFYENPSRLTELDKVREDIDFGNFRTGSVAGVAFRDVNTNGVFEPGTDERLSGVTITLTGTDGSGNTVQRTMDTRTDDTATPENEAGTYSFAGLNPGRYSVEQGTAGDLTQFVPPGGGTHTVSLRSGEQVMRRNFGNASLAALEGTILGRAFRDADADGELDGGEAGLSGVTITLSGTDDAGNPVERTTQVLSDDPNTAADEAGLYSFSDVPGGQYTLEESVPQGYEATGPSDGTRSVTLASGDWRAGLHFGNARRGSIEGVAYRDADDSGTFDPAVDERLSGVTITLRGTSGAGDRVTRTVQTLEDDPQTAANEAGTYAFPGLLPGDYSVDEVVPQDLDLTRPPEGDGYVASLESGEDLAGRDFAHVQPEPPAASIEGQTWEDLEGDGARLGADLEQQGDTFFENAFGGGEKWLRGRRGGWFFVEPDGTVTEWDGTPGVLSGEVAARLDPVVHDEPGRLIDMPREQLLASLPVELRDDDGNLLTTVGTGPIDRNADGEIDPRTEAGQYSLDDLAPGRYTVRQGEAVAWEQTYPSGSQSHEVVIDADRLEVSELDLREPSGSFLQDRYGGGEKWLRGGDGGWFYIRPDGTLARWDGEPGSLSGDEIATLDSRFYENPAALTELDTVKEDVDFGNVKWAVVEGRVFRDVDGNGSYDQEIDEGTAGVTVRLTGTNLLGESVEQTVTTSTDSETSELQDETGVYGFPELLPGTYTIEQVVPEGRVQTTPADDYTVTVGSGGEAENRNFGNVLT
ncbi:MAG: SdrD B-like domain-containing protein, partial [Planctomycetota bacterium]